MHTFRFTSEFRFTIVEDRHGQEVMLWHTRTAKQAIDFISLYDPDGVLRVFVYEGDVKYTLQQLLLEKVEWKEEGF